MKTNSCGQHALDLTIAHCSDEKEIDFAEQLESVAYVLCGEGPITFEKFISIWNARGVSSKRFAFQFKF